MNAAMSSLVLRLRGESAIIVASHALYDDVELPPMTMPLGRAIERIARGREDRRIGRPAMIYFSEGSLNVGDCIELWRELGEDLLDDTEEALPEEG